MTKSQMQAIQQAFHYAILDHKTWISQELEKHDDETRKITKAIVKERHDMLERHHQELDALQKRIDALVAPRNKIRSEFLYGNRLDENRLTAAFQMELEFADQGANALQVLQAFLEKHGVRTK